MSVSDSKETKNELQLIQFRKSELELQKKTNIETQNFEYRKQTKRINGNRKHLNKKLFVFQTAFSI